MLDHNSIGFRAGPLLRLGLAVTLVSAATASFLAATRPSRESSGDARSSATNLNSYQEVSSSVQSDFVAQIQLPANDVVYDPNSQMIFVSVPSTAGSIGNSITVVDPRSRTVQSSTFVGSEPEQLGLTDDGQYIYTILGGPSAVRRYDIASRTAGLQFGDGQAIQLATIPGSPNSIVLKTPLTDPFLQKLAMFDDATQRPGTVVWGQPAVPSYFQCNSTGSTVYAFSMAARGNVLEHLSINADGLATSAMIPSSGAGAFKLDNGLLYLPGGQVLDAESGVLIGTFTFSDQTGPLVAPDSTVGRAFFLTGSSFSQTGNTWTLRAFDEKTFLPVGTLDISGIDGSPVSMVRWGPNGLAFNTTGGQLFFIQSTLVSSSEPVPTPTPTPSPSPSPTPTPAPIDVKQIALPTNDLVLDGNTQTIFASVPSSAGSTGNSITPIDPVTGTLGKPVFVGSEPGKMAISDDSQYIYVGLNGAAAVRRFNVASQAAEMQFGLGTGDGNFALSAGEIAVVPGNPGSVAVARVNRALSSEGGVAIYDGGVQRPVTTPGFAGNRFIRFSVSPSFLYGDRTNAVEPCGVSVFDDRALGLPPFEIDNGVVYTPDGGVADLQLHQTLGIFYYPHKDQGFGYLVSPDSKNGRVYFLKIDSGNRNAVLSAYDLQTFLRVGVETIPGVQGGPIRFLRWGKNGFAFNTESTVYIVQSSLVQNGAPQILVSPPAPPVYSVTGQITDFNMKPVAGIPVVLQGQQIATTSSDANGSYSFGGLSGCQTYTLSVSSPLYTSAGGPSTFTPGSGLVGTILNGKIVDNIEVTPVPKTLEFGSLSYTVNEGDGAATLDVTRKGDLSLPATIDYATSDGTASQTSDYTAAAGTLRFAPGEATKTLQVLITDDANTGIDKTLFISLSNPSAGSLIGYPYSAVLTILDNDSTQPTTNPIDDAQMFVRQQYADFLSRLPDQSGLTYWTDAITHCSSDARCIHNSRVAVADAFFFEPEFQQTGGYVYDIYKAGFGVQPGYAEFHLDRARVVGGSNLDQSKTEFAVGFVQRQAFESKYPSSLDGSAFVDAILKTIRDSGGPDLVANRSDIINVYGTGSDEAHSRGSALQMIAELPAFVDSQYNESFVVMEYFGYLRRDPDAGGEAFWLGQVNKFPPRTIDIQHAMACSFITSNEYQKRFSPIVTHDNSECPQ